MRRALLGIGLALALTAAAPQALAQDDASALRAASATPDDVIRYVPSGAEPSAPGAEPPTPCREASCTEPAPEPRSFRATFEVGGIAQRLIALPVYGVDFGGSLGSDFGSARPVRGMFDLRLEIAFGKTPDGLAARTIHLAPELGVILDDRVRLGGGLQLTNAGFWRGTTGELVDNWLCGAGVFLDVDVARFDGHALFVALRGSVDLRLIGAPGSSADVRNGSLTVGFRY